MKKCKVCGKKVLARGLCNSCYKATRYISTKEEFPLKEGIRLKGYMLSHAESRAIEACAKRRGIGKGYFVIENPRENRELHEGLVNSYIMQCQHERDTY
jgi:hypothetical protein